MKKSFQMLLILFLSTGVSCVDRRYDLDEDRVDNQGVFSPDGINIPIGQIDKISIDHELRKPYDNVISQIQIDEDGGLYIEYEGQFPVVFPDFQSPEIPTIQTAPVEIDLPELSPDLPLILPAVPAGRYSLFNFESTPYEIDRPVFEDTDQGLQIRPNRINFSNLGLDLRFDLTGIRFGAGEANLILTLQYPDNLVLRNQEENPVEKKIPITATESYSSSYVIENIADVLAFEYVENGVGIEYKLELEVISNLVVQTSNSPTQFQMTIAPNSQGRVESFECNVTGSKSYSDAIAIDNFTSAYLDFVFGFSNPQLEFALETNLGCSFDVDVRLTGNTGETALAAGDQLQFEKPEQAYPATRTTAYVLSPRDQSTPGVVWKPFQLNNIFNDVPESLEYEIGIHFDDQAVLYPNDLILNARYKLLLPFVFDSFAVDIRDTVPDLFTEELYEQLFQYARGNISIIVDSVDIHIDRAITVQAEAHLLDENLQPIGIFAASDNVLSSEAEHNRIEILITKTDKEKMRIARHLAFVFELRGEGIVTTRDYIHLRRIRITSDDGIYFN